MRKNQMKKLAASVAAALLSTTMLSACSALSQAPTVVSEESSLHHDTGHQPPYRVQKALKPPILILHPAAGLPIFSSAVTSKLRQSRILRRMSS